MDAKQTPYIFPFLWMHGEDEQTIRRYVRAMHDSNLEAFCVESRPHPDFAGPLWWRDMDIVLEEARRLGMRVWILDDSHFPTGYAAGAMKNAPDELCRQSLICQMIDCPKSGEWMEVSLGDYAQAPAFRPTLMEQYTVDWSKARRFDDDKLIGVVAVKTGGNTRDGLLDLSDAIGRETLRFQVPKGQWKLCLLQLTRNRGPHRDYINMLSAASCRKLIDAVYHALEQDIPLRYIRVTCAETPYNSPVSISGLRVFGLGGGAKPGRVEAGSSVMEDPMTCRLTWDKAEGAVGYNVRFGVAPDKLYASYQVYGREEACLTTLNDGVSYWYAIDAFNESGVTAGMVCKM